MELSYYFESMCENAKLLTFAPGARAENTSTATGTLYLTISQNKTMKPKRIGMDSIRILENGKTCNCPIDLETFVENDKLLTFAPGARAETQTYRRHSKRPI